MAGVTHSDLTVWTDISVCRPSSGVNETLISETENKTCEHFTPEGHVESTTLKIRPATKSQYREFYIAPVRSGAEDRESGPSFSGSIKEEIALSCQVDPRMPDSQREHSPEEDILREKAEVEQLGPVVELQLSLSQERHKGTGAPVVALLGAEKSKSTDTDPNLQHDGIVRINSVPTDKKGDPSLRSSKIVQISSGKELRVIQASEAGHTGLARVEVILNCSDRQKTEGCRLQAGKGCVDSPGEGGQSEAPPSLVSFAVSSEGTEQGEDPHSERDHSRPHKHRARHARKSCPGLLWGCPRGFRTVCHIAAALPVLFFFKIFLIFLIGFKFFFKLMQKLTNVKLWRTSISELEAMNLNFVVDLNVFNALSFVPKGTETVKDNNIINVPFKFVSECCNISC